MKLFQSIMLVVMLLICLKMVVAYNSIAGVEWKEWLYSILLGLSCSLFIGGSDR